ncbi:hypothetical protein A9308_05375 [Moraxella atlantae]|uniref:Uncharacterized protein n=1 Tax=Faucicola atlantae TaxID=34059 RepID=A0A1B8QDG0_9GAMM|nr:hypothetical protein A9308_05375 [Moraxella atlantae]
MKNVSKKCSDLLPSYQYTLAYCGVIRFNTAELGRQTLAQQAPRFVGKILNLMDLRGTNLWHLPLCLCGAVGSLCDIFILI